jgi:hypothetical protein
MAMSAEQRIGAEKWFYRFRLPNGLETHPYGPEKLHDDRLNMLLDTLTREFGNDWNSLSGDAPTCVAKGWALLDDIYAAVLMSARPEALAPVAERAA